MFVLRMECQLGLLAFGVSMQALRGLLMSEQVSGGHVFLFVCVQLGPKSVSVEVFSQCQPLCAESLISIDVFGVETPFF